MNSLIKDISDITNVKEYNLEILNDIAISILSYDIVEDLKSKNNVSEIDIGIGYLYITKEDNIIKYKFIPNSKLEKTIVKSYNGTNMLVEKIDDALNDRIMSSFKELF